MGSLTLEEAAEKAGTSKVDIWRAIREGELSAQRTGAGGFAIDPEDLFRVFERRPAVADEAAGGREVVAPWRPGAANDMEAEFAAVGAELKLLLGLPAEAQSKGDRRHDGADGRQDGADRHVTDLAERNAQLKAELAAVRTIAEKAMAEFASLAERLEATPEARRPWWRRLVR
jgi:hypothetical protein